MRLLITGISGFVGRHMAAYAATHGAPVVGISRAPFVLPHATVLVADLNDSAATDQAVMAAAPDAVVHLAAQTPANSAGQPPQAWLTGTPLATLNLLEAVRTHYPDAAVLIVSSSSVYGHVPYDQLPITEVFPIQPTTLYGISKAVQELLAIRYAAEYGMRVLRARPFNLLGPGEPVAMLTSTLAAQIAAIAAGTQPAIVRMRHRATSRDFTDVRDTVAAYWAILNHGQAGDVYNVCSGVATPIGEIVDRLLRLAGVVADVQETGILTAGDILTQAGSAARLHALAGWQPQVDLDTSLHDLLVYLQTQSQ